MRKRFKHSYFEILYRIKKLSYVCFLELTPGKNAQYCLSPGTISRLMVIDKINHLIMIQLPSKMKKFFSYHSFVFRGQMAMQEKIKYGNTKAGY